MLSTRDLDASARKALRTEFHPSVGLIGTGLCVWACIVGSGVLHTGAHNSVLLVVELCFPV